MTATQDVNVLEIDLCAAGISLRATASDERHRTTSSFATLVGARAAINGDFYVWSQNWRTDGMSMSGGVQWLDTSDHSYTGPIAFGPERAEIAPHWIVAGADEWMEEIVSGHPTILLDGQPIDNNGDALCTVRHPRTVVGLAPDGFTLLLAVVDGRAPARLGMTCDELIGLMQELGAGDALNLDGGGSTTMWIQGAGVVNRPSDGSERWVANHLAVMAPGFGPAVSCRAGPRPVEGLGFADKDSLAWGESSLFKAEYDLLRGDAGALRIAGGLAGASCLGYDLKRPSFTDTNVPGPGKGFFYVAREQDRYGVNGTYDSSTPPSLREWRDADAGAGDCP